MTPDGEDNKLPGEAFETQGLDINLFAAVKLMIMVPTKMQEIRANEMKIHE
jgi:hypothetical protein